MQEPVRDLLENVGLFNLLLPCLLNVLVLLCNRFTYPLVLQSLDRLGLVCFDTCFASILVSTHVFPSLITRRHAMDGIGFYRIALATVLLVFVPFSRNSLGSNVE